MACVLDTCAILWLTIDPDQLSKKAIKTIQKSGDELILSAMSLWEIGQKYRKGKLKLGCTPSQYLGRLNRTKEIFIKPVSPEIALNSTVLDWDHKDPADRIITQTALELNLPLVTADLKIRNFYSKAIW